MFFVLVSASFAEEELVDFNEPPGIWQSQLRALRTGAQALLRKKLKKLGQNFKPNGDEFGCNLAKRR